MTRLLGIFAFRACKVTAEKQIRLPKGVKATTMRKVRSYKPAARRFLHR